MPDEITPGEQTPGSQQQVGGTENWEARYKGLLPKVEQLTLRVRDLEGQLAGKTSENEQLHAELGLKEAEKKAAVDQRDKQLQDVVTAKTTVEKELEDLRALKNKVEVANELKRPDLLGVVDTLPNMSDKEALKSVMQSLASFTDDAVKKREKELLAGVTPLNTGAGSGQNPSVPSSEKEWENAIEKLPLGSKERARAQDDYWDWLSAKHSS